MLKKILIQILRNNENVNINIKYYYAFGVNLKRQNEL